MHIIIHIIILTKSWLYDIFNMDTHIGSFVWNIGKELENIYKHGVDFKTATAVFKDPNRKFYTDAKHSEGEERYFCIGKVEGRVLTVRFTYCNGEIRIIGAGYWRKGVRYYER
jgi:uncharacterized DUF497 family protein